LQSSFKPSFHVIHWQSHWSTLFAVVNLFASQETEENGEVVWPFRTRHAFAHLVSCRKLSQKLQLHSKSVPGQKAFEYVRH